MSYPGVIKDITMFEETHIYLVVSSVVKVYAMEYDRLTVVSTLYTPSFVKNVKKKNGVSFDLTEEQEEHLINIIMMANL